MEKKQAIELSRLIEAWGDSHSLHFQLDKLDSINNRLENFHQWTKNKPIIAGYNITRLGENSYYFLFIDWHRNDHYYLVIYTQNKSTTLAEIRQIVENNDQMELQWKYNPLKRDGKNDQRKAYFKQVFGATTIHIPLPKNSEEVEIFIERLFKLCSNRVKADRIVEVFPLS
ncbi:hypothetical protein [Neobacillus sp. D3-1R]|uniref:hypothetical protein n=1 Tax=Neobacillus sp. D3-1R TaxID=3445778 RepID=UPI003FA16F1B